MLCPSEITMKTIALTQGQVAIIDAEDYEAISRFKWQAFWNGYTFYAVRNVWVGRKRTTMYMHRFLLNPPLGFEVDHRDGDGLNNTRANIRLCTKAENQHNKQPQSGSSNYKGVCWCTRDRIWMAHIKVNRRLLNLGYYHNEEEAALAYNWAATKHFGEFARLNVLS